MSSRATSYKRIFSPAPKIKDNCQAWCKTCANGQKMEAWNTKPQGEKRIIYKLRYQKCQTNPIAMEKAKASQKVWYLQFTSTSAGRSRLNERAKRLRRRHPQRYQQYVRDYRLRNIHNPAWLEHRRAMARARYARNPAPYLAQNAKMRAKRRAAPGEFTGHDVHRLFQVQGGKCIYCGVKVGSTGERWEVDHIIPLARGGTNFPDNLAIACRACNRSKNAKLPAEFLANKNF